MPEARRRDLVFLVGPAAVGKMTVGMELAARTGLKLFYNHQTIELLLKFFSFDSRQFARLNGEFRRRIFEEIAASDLPGLIFTYVWAFDEPADHAEIESYASIFRSAGGAVHYVELQAPQDVRLKRNDTPLRLEHKASKRDVAWSRGNLIRMDERYQLDSGDRFAGRADWLRVDNTHLSPAEVAEQVITRFGLPTNSVSGPPSS